MEKLMDCKTMRCHRTIIVNAAALRSSGALTIYRQFISHLPMNIDGNRYYIFVDPSVEQPVIEGVTYIHDADHSKLHYVWWSMFGLKRWLKRHNITPSVIVSLQNVGTITDYKQVIYYHQSIPFYKKRWSLLKADERTMAFYKYLYPFFVKQTVSENTEIVVQIPFIKKGFIKKYKCNPDRVHVLFPDVEKIDVQKVTPHIFESGVYHFLYPASAVSYKEHKTIVDALVCLRKSNSSLVEQIRIHLTLRMEDYPSLSQYINEEDLSPQFVFDGPMSHDRLLSFYKSSTGLLFPSTIETLGLPLLEAAAFGLPIAASDLEYAHEVLGDYEGVIYIGSYDYSQWAAAIDLMCSQSMRYPNIRPKQSSWREFFHLINNK